MCGSPLIRQPREVPPVCMRPAALKPGWPKGRDRTSVRARMFWASRCRSIRDMEIRVEIEGNEPPEGRVVVGEGQSRSFVGWLELVGLLDALVGRPTLEGSGS